MCETPANIDLVHGSDNALHDFSDSNAGMKQARSLLAARIIGILDDRHLSVRAAKKLTGFAGAEFFRVPNVAFGRFTLGRLIRVPGALDP